MSVYDHRCGDCQVCPSCGKSAWCESDRILVVPCEHHGYCGDCNLTGCPECRFREMTESGEYSAEADPFYQPNNNAAEYEARMAEWREQSGFDSVTNSYKRKGGA